MTSFEHMHNTRCSESYRKDMDEKDTGPAFKEIITEQTAMANL